MNDTLQLASHDYTEDVNRCREMEPHASTNDKTVYTYSSHKMAQYATGSRDNDYQRNENFSIYRFFQIISLIKPLE
jgi:hypothetical protein